MISQTIPPAPCQTVNVDCIILPTRFLIVNLRRAVQPFELTVDEFNSFIRQAIDILQEDFYIRGDHGHGMYIPKHNEFMTLEQAHPKDLDEFTNIFHWFTMNLREIIKMFAQKYSLLENNGLKGYFYDLHCENIVLNIFKSL